MPSEFAFNWRPGLLEWLIVLELVILLVLAAYRYVAYLLGRNAPTDPFVIFYRTFWRAFRTPKRYPIPVNYQPVPPKRDKPRLEESLDGAGLTDEEIEALMTSDALADPDAAPRAAASGDSPAPSEEGDEFQSLLPVRVVTERSAGVLRIEEGTLVVAVDVAPDDGRANRIVIQNACTVLRLKPHQVAIHAGHTKADKTLRLSGMGSQQLAERLRELGGAHEETFGFAPGS